MLHILVWVVHLVACAICKLSSVITASVLSKWILWEMKRIKRNERDSIKKCNSQKKNERLYGVTRTTDSSLWKKLKLERSKQTSANESKHSPCKQWKDERNGPTPYEKLMLLWTLFSFSYKKTLKHTIYVYVQTMSTEKSLLTVSYIGQHSTFNSLFTCVLSLSLDCALFLYSSSLSSVRFVCLMHLRSIVLLFSLHFGACHRMCALFFLWFLCSVDICRIICI